MLNEANHCVIHTKAGATNTMTWNIIHVTASQTLNLGHLGIPAYSNKSPAHE